MILAMKIVTIPETGISTIVPTNRDRDHITSDPMVASTRIEALTLAEEVIGVRMASVETKSIERYEW